MITAVLRVTALRLLLEPRHGDAVARELIGALVLVVAGVAPDPVPAHLMRLERGIEPLPQLGGLDRLLVLGSPAVFLPPMAPGGAVRGTVLAVGLESAV